MDELKTKKPEQKKHRANTTINKDNTIKPHFQVGMVSSVFKPTINEKISISELFEQIKVGGENKGFIQSLRAMGDKKSPAYKEKKKKLPAFTLGKFKNSYVINDNFESTQMLVFDVDDLILEEITKAKEILFNDVHVFAIFLSPGGLGLKIIVKTNMIKSSSEYHHIYNCIKVYYEKLIGYKLDNTNDPRRLNFFSYDPDIYINDDAKNFITDNFVETELPIPQNKPPVQLQSADKEKALGCLKDIKVSTYDEWITVGIALSNSGCSWEDWDEWSQGQYGFEKDVCEEKWKTFQFDGALTVGTLIYMAKKNGYNCKHSINTDWPEPDNIFKYVKLASVKPFTPDLLPQFLAQFVVDISERMQAPMDFISIPLMTALSSLIASIIDIRPKQHDNWTVTPNVWGVTIGLPSVKKTPAANEAFKPIRSLEKKANDIYELGLASYDNENFINKARLQEVDTKMKGVAKKQNADEKNSMYQNIAKEREKILKENKKPVLARYAVAETSTEKLQELQSVQPGRSLCLIRDEIVGFLRKQDKQGNENSRSYYLESWSGNQPYTNDTISRGSIYIERNCLSIYGTTQPDVWRNYLHDTLHGTSKNDGQPQRFQLAVYPDLPDFKFVDKKPDSESINLTNELFEYADDLNPEQLGAEKNSEGRPYLRFTKEAQAIFDQWYTKHNVWLRRTKDLPNYLESHFSKYDSLIPSIALIIHVAERNKGNVDAESLEKAIKWGEYLKSHAHRIYGSILPQEEETARLIADKILNNKLPTEFKIRDLYLKHWSGITSKTAEAGLKVLEDAGWGRLENRAAGNKPSWIFITNPNVFKNKGLFKESTKEQVSIGSIEETSPIEPIVPSYIAENNTENGCLNKAALAEQELDGMDILQ